MSKLRFKISPDVSDETRVFMRVVLQRLDGTAEPCDQGSLRMLMVAYDMYVRASDTLLREGAMIEDKHGDRKVNPAVSLTKSYWGQVVTLMREMGLTIRSRERIKAMAPAVDDDDELMRFVR